MPKTNKILIAPLNWGLGHATRCIPLITALLANDCEVLIAAEGNTRSLLKAEFPQLTFLLLKGYKISYSRQKKWLPLKIISQIPGFLLSMVNEHLWLRRIVKTHSIDAVVSDNRFGLFHATIPTVYITHQLLIKTGNTFSETLLRKFHFWVIKKYTQCWVPDFEGDENIAGQLSHRSVIPANTKYIGCLSRFEIFNTVKTKYDLLILLSGPEPQRTIFEKLLLSQIEQFTGSVLFVRGLPGETGISNIKARTSDNFQIKNHLSTQELNLAILQTKIVISRSGYTTVMDLIKLQKKAVLVPTPGQTEQEYLADNLMQQKLFYSVEQNGFLLKESLAKADNFSSPFSTHDMEQYKKIVYQFVQNIGHAGG